MLDLKDVLRQVRRLEIRTERMVDSLAAGAYRSRFRGQGMEFEEVREYTPGDDVRHIDWNVTARTGNGRTAFIKTFREERDLTCLLLVDVSGSMNFGAIPGCSPRTKLHAATEAAAIVGTTAMRNNDTLGLVTFSNRTHVHIPCRKGRGHVMRILREVLSADAGHQPTCMTRALEELHHTTRKRAVCFLVSDFLQSEIEFGATLMRVARRHDIIGLRVADPGEAALPARGGPLVLRDPESGAETVLANTRAGRRRYAAAYQAQRSATERLFANARCELVDVRTDLSTFTALRRFFEQRRRRHHG